MKCASIRSTIVSPRSPVGTRAGGTPPWRAAISSHTRARTRARAASIRCRVAWSTSASARDTVAGGEPVPVQHPRQGGGQAATVGGQPQCGHPRVCDHRVAVSGDRQTLGPSGRVVHAKSASRHGFHLVFATRILPDRRHFSLSTHDTSQQDHETLRYTATCSTPAPTDEYADPENWVNCDTREARA